MPDFEKHINQACHNKKLVLTLTSNHNGLYNDWVVTTSFYSVIHIVEAMIYKSDKIMVPSAPLPRYKSKVLVKKTGVKHSGELSDVYAKKGHELRAKIIKDNKWLFNDVGVVCLCLRGLSQSARYDCQDIDQEDADCACNNLFKAIKSYNSWAIKKELMTIN